MQVSASDTEVGTACAAFGNGGSRLRSELDEGLPSGVARDGVLQDGEVDVTSYVCNGRDGVDGEDGASGANGTNGTNG